MIAVTRSDIKKLDGWAINELGIPETLLMENAGKSVAQAALTSSRSIRRAAVISGKGRNGGDGFVAARHLFASGCAIEVFLLSDRPSIEGSSRTNLDILDRMSIPVIPVLGENGLAKLRDTLNGSDLVIDAIFGIGLSGEISGVASSVIDLVNSIKTERAGRRPYIVVSADIPSGVDADTGACDRSSINADVTVTFSYVKKGMLSYPAIEKVGRLVITDIGIPRSNVLTKPEAGGPSKKGPMDLSIISPEHVASMFPHRSQSAHKGSCGRVLVVAGSAGMSGAAMLTARAAMRVGAGLVKLAVPRGIASNVDAMLPEAITLPLAETRGGSIGPGSIGEIMRACRQADCIAVGPGMSLDSGTVRSLKDLIKGVKKENLAAPLVIDADALNALAGEPSALKGLPAGSVVTPHPGEMSRLTGLSVEQVQAARVEISRKFAMENGVNVILKGARTVVISGDGEIKMNITGNPGMATAGMGDVLTGAVAGLMGQGMLPFEACQAAVFVHGMAGDVICSQKGEHGLLSSDVCEALPYVIKTVLS